MSTAPTRTVRAALERAGTEAAVGQMLVTVVVATLVASRAAHHTLSAAALVGLVAGWAATLACIGWPRGVFEGAAQVIAEDVRLSDSGSGAWAAEQATSAAERHGNPFGARAVWSGAFAVAVLAAAWAAAGAGLVAAVLNGRQARWVVIYAALVGLAGAAAVATDLAARRYGMVAARRMLDRGIVPSPLRRRAWLDIALPVAVVQGLVNGGASWVLFHSYQRPTAFGSSTPTLSAHTAVADVVTGAVVLAVLFGTTAWRWGATDAAMGTVAVPPPPAGRRPFGPQAIVYLVAASLVLGRVVQYLLPAVPHLPAVGLARGVLLGALGGAVAALAYVAGASNQRMAASAGSAP